MDEGPSRRVVEQIIRTRIMDVAELFASGTQGVRDMGAPGSWLNYFFDYMWETADIDRLSTLNALEQDQLKALWHLVDQCCPAMQANNSLDEWIATGWPDRIAPTAEAVFQAMTSRGAFSEEVEEDEPSQGWPPTWRS